MNKAFGSEVLLTSDDIRHWRADLLRWERTKAEADEHIIELRKKLEAAALLFGADVPAEPLPVSVQVEESQESMADAVRRILGASSRPVRHHELLGELKKIARFRESLNKNSGAYYYTLIRRLVDAGDIKKTGKKLRLIHKNEAPSEENPEGALTAFETGPSQSGEPLAKGREAGPGGGP
jgi:hypothetical protein